jgi:hypothetical protein
VRTHGEHDGCCGTAIWGIRLELVRYDAAADGAIYGVPPGRLYNLTEDIGETHDLAAERPEKVKEFQATWDEWNKGNVEPLWRDESRCTWGAPLRCLYLWIPAVLPDDWL